jgi:hypothetical protein
VTTEHLGGFEPRDPGRRRYVWAAVGVVLVVVVGWSLTVGRPESLPPTPSPSPTPTQSRTVFSTPTNPLHLDERCEPVTDGTDVLQLSFTLVNASDEGAELTNVRPILPMDALQPIKTEVSLGHCYDPLTSEDPSHLVAVGESVHVRFTLKLPPDCPQPYPVNAEVTIGQPENSDRRYGVALYPDLGGIAFDTC